MAAFNRRGFMGASLSLASALAANPIFSDDRPPVRHPRATDGDGRHEPNWAERFTLTVGTKKGDLIGNNDRVLQAAVDYVARLGGGTVHVLPGTYSLRNSIFLPSKVRILGSGADSVLTKIASETVALSEDSDWYDQEITVSKSSGFQVGDGVVLKTKNPHTGGTDVLRRTLVARKGNRFKLDDGLRKNFWLTGKPTCSSLFPLLVSERTSDVVIENIALDGNKKNNENLNGNYGGGIFLQDCNRYTFRKVESRNYNGDGFSFQICHDVIVDSCHSHDNANLGVHPGSGSQRPLIVNNRLENNDIGIFWCWGVRYGLAEKNHIDGNRDYGISIGHNDTDNVMRDNVVLNSGKVGILFRNDSRGKDFWANRNVIENNRIENSGDENGVGIDIQGKTKDLQIVGNRLNETRKPMNRTGIRIHADAARIELRDNAIQGFAKTVDDQRSA